MAHNNTAMRVARFKVLRYYHYAFAKEWADGNQLIWIIDSSWNCDEGSELGRGKTEEEAWINAASIL